MASERIQNETDYFFKGEEGQVLRAYKNPGPTSVALAEWNQSLPRASRLGLAAKIFGGFTAAAVALQLTEGHASASGGDFGARIDAQSFAFNPAFDLPHLAQIDVSSISNHYMNHPIYIDNVNRPVEPPPGTDTEPGIFQLTDHWPIPDITDAYFSVDPKLTGHILPIALNLMTETGDPQAQFTVDMITLRSNQTANGRPDSFTRLPIISVDTGQMWAIFAKGENGTLTTPRTSPNPDNLVAIPIVVDQGSETASLPGPVTDEVIAYLDSPNLEQGRIPFFARRGNTLNLIDPISGEEFELLNNVDGDNENGPGGKVVAALVRTESDIDIDEPPTTLQPEYNLLPFVTVETGSIVHGVPINAAVQLDESVKPILMTLEMSNNYSDELSEYFARTVYEAWLHVGAYADNPAYQNMTFEDFMGLLEKVRSGDDAIDPMSVAIKVHVNDLNDGKPHLTPEGEFNPESESQVWLVVWPGDKAKLPNDFQGLPVRRVDRIEMPQADADKTPQVVTNENGMGYAIELNGETLVITNGTKNLSSPDKGASLRTRLHGAAQWLWKYKGDGKAVHLVSVNHIKKLLAKIKFIITPN